MILITSAAYTNPSLTSELGMLPPCMLPVQNRRLYVHQLSLFEGSGEQVYMSLPASYQMTSYDREQLAKNHVEVIQVPDRLSLGQSVVYCLNTVGRFGEPLYLLHGDTLFGRLTLKPDTCVVAKAEDNYTWAPVDVVDQTVYAGFFAFSSQSLLINCITVQQNDFIAGVELYGTHCPMERIMSDSWMDFGLVNTYYRSISNLTTQRVFNSMSIDRFSIKKSSRDVNKMMAEANWIQSLPKGLRHYAPAIWDSGIEGDKGFYEMEYYYLSSLANLFVFCRHPQFVWHDIFTACQAFVSDAACYKPESEDEISEIACRNDDLYLSKTLKRLNQYAQQTGVSLDTQWVINGVTTPSLCEIVNETGAMIAANQTDFVSLMHGDFCFSNILYDFKSRSIKVIDPRGVDNEGHLSIYGDLRYDVAKLAHSVLGLYDFIIGGMFHYHENSSNDISLVFDITDDIRATQEYFKTLQFAEYSIDQLSVYPIMIHLFLSMLPLHSDNEERQKAMLANALRLYVELKGLKK